MNSGLRGSPILRALVRARVAILAMALTYVLSVVVGAVMVHTGNAFALTYRDDLVAQARASDPAAIALREGDRLRAALLDFGRNLLLGAVPKTVAGVSVLVPFPLAAHQGWVGGIVSVDSTHASRLARPDEARYYLLTLALQLLPYSLAVGAGVNLGLAYFRPRPYYQGARWWGLPAEAVRDVLRIYVLVVPLFLVASLWEFLAR
jgi:uncharacterized membrane protein SpoIIM required for sporulation